MAAFLDVRAVSVKYGPTYALKDVSLAIDRGELVGVLGPSGAGKTTLLNAVAGLVALESGQILLGSVNLERVPIFRRNIGVVFQGYRLFPHLTAYENVRYPLRTKPHRVSRAEARKRVEQTLELVGLHGLGRRRPSELSGGQQQRVALARALVYRPQVLLLDEPFAAVDRNLRSTLQNELRQIQKQLAVTSILVTHDQEDAMAVADRLVILEKAEVVQVGTPDTVYSRPQSEFAARLLGDANFVEGKVISCEESSVVVESSLGELRAPNKLGRELLDEVVLLMVRPEDLRLGRLQDRPSACNTLPATLLGTRFMGGRIRCDLSLGNGTVWNVLRDNSAAHELGDQTNLVWKIDSTHVLIKE